MEPRWNLGGTLVNLPQDLLTRNLLTAQYGSAPEDQRHLTTSATLVEPWWDATKLEELWWNLPRNLSAAQYGSAPEDQRHLTTSAKLVEPWWDATKLEELWWNLPRNLSAAQYGSAPEDQRHLTTSAKLVEPWWDATKLEELWWNLPRNPLWRPNTNLPQKTRDTLQLPQLWWNLGETPRNLKNFGGTFRGTFWRPNTDLPQRTVESLPPNLYYGWRPQSYCCWGKRTRLKFLSPHCGCRSFQPQMFQLALAMMSRKQKAKTQFAVVQLRLKRRSFTRHCCVVILSNFTTSFCLSLKNGSFLSLKAWCLSWQKPLMCTWCGVHRHCDTYSGVQRVLETSLSIWSTRKISQRLNVESTTFQSWRNFWRCSSRHDSILMAPSICWNC